MPYFLFGTYMLTHSFSKRTLLALMAIASLLTLSACGGGGGGGSAPVANNGTLTNPSNYTLPNGGVSTVPATGTTN
jgi:ABC-type glycerol-3-phosphate transport system substrate-binding protein